MRNLKTLLIFGALTASVASQAVLVPTAPFPSPRFENFDAIALGSYVGFPGMAGFAGFSRNTTSNALLITNAPILPPLSGAHAMCGRGTNVLIRFQADCKRFGGYFRMANAGVLVNNALFIFRNAANVVVGIANGPINNVAWQWRGWGSSVPFRSVEIIGNGPVPGYVGMDDVRVL